MPEENKDVENQTTFEVRDSEDDEIIVVCKSCRNIQSPQAVMGSIWYQQGTALPPCNCGGPTMEINKSDYDLFVDRSRRGHFFP